MVAGLMGVRAPSRPTVYWEMVPWAAAQPGPAQAKLATYAYLPLGEITMEAGKGPVGTVGVLIGGSSPVVPILYCDTVLSPRLATYACLFAGSMVTPLGCVPVFTVPVVPTGVSAPLPMVYSDTVLAAQF